MRARGSVCRYGDVDDHDDDDNEDNVRNDC